ncbi:MAG: hypothetical protein JNN01_00635 [Opitutaceae bacterium]|nr:hypothetical protein [Opitutaceae bacterium]
MLSALSVLMAVPAAAVPDSGSTALLFGAAVIGAGLIARFLKNRKS